MIKLGEKHTLVAKAGGNRLVPVSQVVNATEKFWKESKSATSSEYE